MLARAPICTAAAAVALAALTFSPVSRADEGPGPWRHTGDGMMTKTVAFVTVDVFAVGHDIRCVPEHKSKTVVAAIDCDKRLQFVAVRDVDRATIRDTLRSAYRSVDYRDEARIARAVGLFKTDLDEGSRVTISYDAAAKATTFQYKGGKVAIDGYPFMRATWSVLFGTGEASELGDALISKL